MSDATAEISVISSMFKIDIDSNKIEHQEIDSNQNDLAVYIQDIQKEINARETKRKFAFNSSKTEFYTTLLEITASVRNDDIYEEEKFCENLAQRLLIKEVETDKQMSGINPLGHLKRGAFLQFFYKEKDDYVYFGIKIEFRSIVDESDFKVKTGMPYINKSYKACKVYIHQDNTADVTLYDTNPRITKYWWFDFLELKEEHTNEYNTETATRSIITRLGPIQRYAKVDYTLLRHATIAAFKKESPINYVDLIDSIFSYYLPISSQLKMAMPKLVEDLKNMPEKKNFDTQFESIPSAVPYKSKKKYSLNSDIEILVTDGMTSIGDKIWSDRLDDGKQVVVIDSPEGFKMFPKRNANKEIGQ